MYERIWWSSSILFCKMLLLSFCIESKLWLIWKTWPFGVVIYSVLNITYLLCTHFESHRIITHFRSLECYADGHHKCYTENEVYISSAHVYGHCPIGLLLQNTSSKIKLLRISKWQVQNIKPNHLNLLSTGPLWLNRLHTWRGICS